MSDKSGKNTVWPAGLSVAAQAQLDRLKAAHGVATAAWKQGHPKSKQEAIPHRDFLREIGVAMDPTVLSRLLSAGGYPGRAEEHLQTLAAAVDQWVAGRVFAECREGRPAFVLDWYPGLVEAVQEAASWEGSEERGGVVIAPTGGGKTMLANHLVSAVGRVRIIRARGSWRGSYFAVVASFLEQLGLSVPRTARLAEVALFSYLNANKLTLILDEQDLLGRDALNLIRAIMNETRATVVCLFIPETWDRIVKDGGEYAKQFCRRCKFQVKVPPVSAADAVLFLTENKLDMEPADRAETAAVLAREANVFGWLSLLENVTRAMAEIPLNAGQTRAEQAGVFCAFYRKRHGLSLSLATAVRGGLSK